MQKLLSFSSRLAFSCLILLFLLTSSMKAQNLPAEFHYSADGKILSRGDELASGLYDRTIIRDIHIDFPQTNYWSLLTANYSTETDIPATLTLDGITYDSVGVRFRGNTSYQMIGNSQKKSFAVAADFIHPDQLIMGYKNLKFNNAHQDASFLREVLYNRMAKKYTPIAKANFIHLFINNLDWGVYPNIQDLDKTYLKEWFLSNDGAKFRATVEGSGPGGGGGPGWGDGTAGMNYLGADSTLYKKYYSLKSTEVDESWQKLIHVCQVLSTAAVNNMEVVSQTLDIDKILWYLAVENIFADDDSYVMKGKMDYYVYYEPETALTFPLEYDGNSAFLTEAATSWSPFKNVSNANYPLLNKLLNIPEWRQRYLAHYRTILDETFTTANASAIIDTLDSQIKGLVAADTKKLYPTSQYTSAIPALKSFVTSRRNYLISNSEVAQVAPQIVFADYTNSNDESSAPFAGEQAYIKANVSSGNGISKVNLFYDDGLIGTFQKTSMADDGLHHDGAAADGIFGGTIPGFNAGTLVRYYIEAVSANAALSSSYLPQGAEHDVFAYTVLAPLSGNGVVINELLASNATNETDEAGDHDDWVELYNNNNFQVNLSGYYVSDDITLPTKWQIPSGTSIPANGYVIIWADNEEAEGPLHANWKISSSGESIYLLDASQVLLDSVNFGQQVVDKGFARVPNGTGGFVIQDATYKASNNIQHTSNGVVINEVLASNTTGATDEAGDLEDWVELYNNNNFNVNLSGFHLSDDGGILDKWTFPSGTNIAAHGYLIIWADNEGTEGPLHASWKISNGGESVTFSDPLLQILDQVAFGPQGADTAYARVPNGIGNFIQQAPTFNANNETTSATHDLAHHDIQLYPNPVQDVIMIKADDEVIGKEYFISDMMGRVLKTGILSQTLNAIDVTALATGQYLFIIRNKTSIPVKLIKL
jgi:hypothetical protein